MSDLFAVPHLGVRSSSREGGIKVDDSSTSDRLLSCGLVPLGSPGQCIRTTDQDAGAGSCWSDPAFLSSRGCGGGGGGGAGAAAAGVQFLATDDDQYNITAAAHDFEAEMANNGRRFESPNAAMVMRNASRSLTNTALLAASCSSPADPLQEEALVMGCGQKRSFYPTFFEASVINEPGDDEDAAAADDYSCPHNNGELKKRRLSFDQVRSLERNFELENKLEPEKKMQLAKELGLQPRQVAVWFQNRRARWKTKQLERDYEVLNCDYNKLKSELEAVLEEKRELEAKVLMHHSTLSPEDVKQQPRIGASSTGQTPASTSCRRKDGSASLESTSIKLEDGTTEVPSFQDHQDSCNYLLTQVDEQGASLPAAWWNWPMSNTGP
ncbi:unnamed protein product [Sphagnum jensenii]|uniref:Homeobox domain-containing protein n=1 Tax=Sphagnum jensenii TaxID=128206 RepID=A0ABP0W527_9BRYO